MITHHLQNFLLIIQALNKHQVDYVIIGGVAVILHGLERLTRDLDIFIRLDSTNIDRVKKALSSIYDDAAIEEINLKELEKYPVIRYGTPDGFYIDIMVRLGEAVSFDDLKSEEIEFKGVKIKIATPETLYQLKKDTRRFQDQADALFLKELIDRSK